MKTQCAWNSQGNQEETQRLDWQQDTGDSIKGWLKRRGNRNRKQITQNTKGDKTIKIRQEILKWQTMTSLTAALWEELWPHSVQRFHLLIIHTQKNNNNAKTNKGHGNWFTNLMTLSCKQDVNWKNTDMLVLSQRSSILTGSMDYVPAGNVRLRLAALDSQFVLWSHLKRLKW